MIDPTYLRTIHDGLLSGAMHKDNASTLPIGLIGIYEEALPPASNVNDRKKFMEFFAVWALLKKEVSVAFVVPLLEGWTEEHVLDYISKYSKWFNSPVSGKYVLYHERIRSFLLQKVSHGHFTACNESLIQNCQTALQAKSGDEWDYYALEHLSLHLLIQAMESKNAAALKTLAYDTTHWNRQVEISKGFEWSKRMLNDMMLWASKHDEEEVIECALNKVDLHHQEQNDAPRIVELVAQNDIETALQRIEAFGGNDKEGLQRKFILYMLCLMELTLLESKDKPFRKDAIEKLLKHLDNNLPVDHSVLKWNDFFPSYLMFQMACEWAEMGLDYLIVYKRMDDETDKISALQNILTKLANQGKIEEALEYAKGITDESDKSLALKAISTELAKQGKLEEAASAMQEALECAKGIGDESEKNIALMDISTELVKQGKVELAASVIEEALACAQGINSDRTKSSALKEISIKMAIQGKVEEALACAMGISDDRIKSRALVDISIEMAIKGKVEEALECARGITDDRLKNSALMNISTELAKQGKVEEALQCAERISDETYKISPLKDISTILAKEGKLEEAASAMQEAFECTRSISEESRKNSELKEISTELAKQGIIEKAIEHTSYIIDEFYNIGTLREISNAIDNVDILYMALDKIKKTKDDSTTFREKGEELKLIAIEFHKRGLYHIYLPLINDSLNLLSLLSYNWSDKGGILEEMAIELAAIGELKDAYKVIGKLRYLSEKESTLKNISDQEAVLGNFRNCSIVLLKLLSINKELGEKEIDTLSIDISIYLSRRNFTDNAVIIAKSISNDWDNAYALWQIALECIKQDKFQIGFEIALNIEDRNHINQACEEIANELIKRGYINEALNILQRLADSIDYCQSSILIELSSQLYSQNKIENASLLIRKAHECIPSRDDDFNKVELLLRIYSELTKHGDLEQAASAMQDSFECTRCISDESEKSSSLLAISNELVKQGKIEEAASAIKEALECARTINEESEKSSALQNISSGLAKQGKIEEAEIAMQEALECARAISNDSHKSKALNSISKELAKQGKIEEALECARAISNDSHKSSALRFISIELASQGKIEEALECAQGIIDDYRNNSALEGISTEMINQGKLEEALECARSITDESNKGSTLEKISTELINQGKLEEAIECARSITDNYSKSSAIEHISFELAKQGNWPLAEKTGIEIPTVYSRFEFWKRIAGLVTEQEGWLKALEHLSNFKNQDVHKYYLKGLTEIIKTSDFDKALLLYARGYYQNDIVSIEKLLHHHALYELFFSNAASEKIERFNRTLNIQWALDIKNSFSVN